MSELTFAIDGDALLWTGDGEYLRIEPWGKNSVRVRASKMHEIQEQEGALLPQDNQASGSHNYGITIDKPNRTAELRNGDIVVQAKASCGLYSGSGYEEPRCLLSFYKADGTPLIQEIPSGGSLNLRARWFKPITGGDYSIVASFTTPENEKLYGMGEYQQNILNLKGCTLELAHRNSQASIPFVVSSAGYGFLWNNPALGNVTFGKNRTEWQAESAKQIDYWITTGDTPSSIMKHYADATGHAPHMPEWGLGFWQCKLRYWNQRQLLDVAHGFKQRNIPLDLIVVDFFHWPHMGDFRFENEFWPDPKAMADDLHSMGVKLMVSVWPQVALASENYVEMKSKNLLVRADKGEDVGMMFEGPSQFYDATNPKAREYVWEKCRTNYAELGVDAFWLDEAEPEYGTYDFDNYRYYAGPNQQGMAGIPWFTTDMGGFHDGIIDSDDFKELLARWCAFSCFLPVMRNHGDRSLHTATGKETITNSAGDHRSPSGADNEPWSYGPEMEQIFRKFIAIREKMRPYTRELFESAHIDGQPLVRGLFYEFPQDKSVSDIADEYMFGPDILVAPVVEAGARSREVTLPGNASITWTDLRIGKMYEGGQKITVDAGIDTIPAFARDGHDHGLIGML